MSNADSVSAFHGRTRPADPTFELSWSANATGRLNWVKFPHYKLFDKTVTNNTVIEKPVPVYSYKENSHLYFYFGVNTMFDKGLSGVSGGFNFISKKGWGVGVGYLRIEKMNAMEAKVLLRIL